MTGNPETDYFLLGCIVAAILFLMCASAKRGPW